MAEQSGAHIFKSLAFLHVWLEANKERQPNGDA
jgi:hypothetical protein